jgi:protein tyrosine phosphatase (PTP) superfamily phosphohydrolase (DUF442 family)
VIVSLALLALVQTGCQSGLGLCGDPCNPCSTGPVRTWFRQRMSSWNRPDDCCNGSVVSGVPMTEGAPAVIAPAPAVTPAPGSALPPPTEVAPQLEPVPSATPAPTPSSGSSSSGSGSSTNGSQGARSPTGRADYEAARPRYYIGRSRGSGGSLRSFVQRTPSPTSRSAQGAAVASGTAAVSAAQPAERRASELSLLDNLPPLDLPRDVTRSDVTTAAAVESRPAPANLPPPVDGAGTEAPPPAGAATLPAEVSVAPGLKRFAAVEPKLAGGSLPAADGLDWLGEKGYKTLVDLREPGDVQPAFLAEVSRRGLRYISLPIGLPNVDRDHVNRFEFEISLEGARPLYFFDTDGNRAGMLWYIHRMTDGKESYDAEEALHQAGELGLLDEAFRKAAQKYLDGLKKPASSVPPSAPAAPAPAQAPRRASTTPGPAPERPGAPGPAGPAPVGAGAPAPAARAGLPEQSTIPANPETIALPDPGTLDLARVAPPPVAPPPDSAAAADPNAWRPYLALVFAALGLPVAYCGRSLIQFRGLLRASLPAPGRRLRSLPGGSGE